MKNKFFAFLNFILRSNLYIAVCAYFFTQFCLSSFQLSQLDSLSRYPHFVGICVFFVYGLQRIVESKNHSPNGDKNKYKWYQQHFLIMVFLIVIAFVSLLLVFNHLLSQSFWIILPPFIVSLLYFVGPKPLKALNFGKGFVIGITWSYVCVILPCVVSGHQLLISDVLLTAISVFFFVSAICIPFDIRDAEVDRFKNIRSLPVLLGQTISKIIAVCLLLLSVVIECFQSGHEAQLLSLIFTAAAAVPVIIFSFPGNHPFYFSLLTDGLLLLPIIFMQVFS